MIPYFALFLILAAAALVEGLRPRFDRPRFLLLSGVLIALAIGLRLEVGGDWYVYLRAFTRLKLVDLETALDFTDPGYGFVNWLVAQAGLRVWGVNLICAVIFTWGLLSLAWQQPNPQLAMLSAVPYLIIVVAMGYTRQSAALGFVMLGLAQYLRGATLRMLLSLLLAVTFHKSAVVIIPLIALASSRGSFFTALSLVLLAVATYYAFLADSTDRLFRNYIQHGYDSSGAAVRIAMTLIPAVIFLGFRNRFGFDQKGMRLWLVFALASVIAQAAYFVSPSSTAVDRIALYLIPLQLVILARLPEAFGSAERRNFLVLVAVVAYLFSVQFVWLNFGRFSWAWLPYKNYLWMPSDYVEKQHKR